MKRGTRPVDPGYAPRTMGIPISQQDMLPAYKPVERYEDLLPNSLACVRVDVIRATGGGTIHEIRVKAIEMGDAIDYKGHDRDKILKSFADVARYPFIKCRFVATRLRDYRYAEEN